MTMAGASTAGAATLQFLGLEPEPPVNPEWLALSGDGASLYVVGDHDDAVATYARNPATGALTLVETEHDGTAGVDGLDGARAVAVSPDDQHVYVASVVDDAVAVFARDAGTGALGFIESERNGVGGVEGLDGAFAVTVSPDGTSVYVASIDAGAIASFHRDTGTGELEFVEAELDGTAGVDGLAGALAVAVSPDNASVYVASLIDDAVVVFDRDVGTGALDFVERERDGVAGVDGLDNGESVAVSPDGAHVYVASSGDHAVAAFARDPGTGALSFIEAERDGVAGIDGLLGIHALALSADGASLYAAGSGDNTIALFTRDAGTGTLSFVEALRDGFGGVDGLYGAEFVAPSPDGGHVYVASTADDAVAIFGQRCGNGVLDPGEECDDGNTLPDDGCEPTCTPTGCGDGAIAGVEECDDGNILSGDCCTPGCELEPENSPCADDGSACTEDRCDGDGACGNSPIIGPCDDGNPCTQDDACSAGVCTGIAGPTSGCRAPNKGRVLLRGDRLTWLWANGQETDLAALGDPYLFGGTDYFLCIYDASADPQPRFAALAPAGGSCAQERPCWRDGIGNLRIDYVDVFGTPDGLFMIRLKAGPDGTARVLVRGKGPNLDVPALPFVPPVTIELHTEEGECWGADYDTPMVNDGDVFKARFE
jgi:cysteine-rich repeat protein